MNIKAIHFEEKSIVKMLVAFVLVAVFIAVFGPQAYAQFARQTGSSGWGYGYGYGYGYGFGFDGGATAGYKTDFSTSAANVNGYGYGYGYVPAASSGSGTIYSSTNSQYEVTDSQISDLVTVGALTPDGSDITSTTAVTFQQQTQITVGSVTITIPASTTMTASSATTFAALAASTSVTTSDLPSNVSSVSAVQFGLSSVGLTLNQAITIRLSVNSAYNGQSLTVYKKAPGGSWASLTTCTVSSGVCSFTTTSLSDFAATTSTGGGGGGGGGGYAGVMGDAMVIVNNNNRATTAREVTLKLRATGATQMMISSSADFSGAEWEAFAETKTWTLGETEGVQYVYAKFKNSAGSISGVVSDSILYDTNATTSEVVGTSGGQTTATTCVQYTQQLKLGSKGDEVTMLQTYLKQFPDIYPEGLVTGYFGPLTEAAVKRFQEKYGIASEGVSGYGQVGPKTRAQLNTLTCASSGVQGTVQLQLRTLQEQVIQLMMKLLAMLQQQLATLLGAN